MRKNYKMNVTSPKLNSLYQRTTNKINSGESIIQKSLDFQADEPLVDKAGDSKLPGIQ